MWNVELSWTSISYVPASRCVTLAPFIVSEIVKPSPVPTVATRTPGGGGGGAAGVEEEVAGEEAVAAVGGGPVLTLIVPTMFRWKVQW